MKPILATIAAETPGLFRVAIIHRPQAATEGGAVVAWLMRNGCFETPRSPKEAQRIAEYPRAKAERELNRAASVVRAMPAAA